MNLNVSVNNIMFRNEEDETVAKVRFRAEDQAQEIEIRGTVTLSKEEYENNSSMEELADLVSDKATERLKN